METHGNESAHQRISGRYKIADCCAMRVVVFGALERQVACEQCGYCDAAVRMHHFAGSSCMRLPCTQYGIPIHFCSAQCERAGVAQLAARPENADAAPGTLTVKHHTKRRRLWQ